MTAAAKKQTKAEPQQAASTAQAPQAPKPAVPTPANRQTATFDKLKAAWEARGVSTEKIELKPDGKFLNVIVGEGWPLIVIGASGGITLPTIRSYTTAFGAAVNGDKLLAKQNERDQKKTASPPPPPAQAAKPQSTSASKPETPAAKKQKEHRSLETQLA